MGVVVAGGLVVGRVVLVRVVRPWQLADIDDDGITPAPAAAPEPAARH